MKLIDEKGKFFGKINAIDFVIILIVIVLAVATYQKFFKMDNTSITQTMLPIKYDVEILGCREQLSNAIKQGDELYDKISGKIGNITNISKRTAKQTIQLADGSYKECDVPNRYDITLTVEAEGIVNSEGHFVNKSYELVVNSLKNFKTKYANASGKVMKIYTEGE